MNLTDKPDYLTVTGTINPQDQSEYLLTEGLSWNATATSATPAHGTFTLGAGDSFDVTSVLGDKTGNGDWDGKTLTKLGAGKLTLSARIPIAAILTYRKARCGWPVPVRLAKWAASRR